ncbi:MAG: PA14 domain-containing protein [Caldilineales bacterium]
MGAAHADRPRSGIPRDALILFIIAGVIFVACARPPRVLRAAGATFAAWQRRGQLVTLAGLAAGVAALALLWLDLGSIPGLLLWPVATVLFVAGAFLEEPEGERKERRETTESRENRETTEREDTDGGELDAESAAADASPAVEASIEEPAAADDPSLITDDASRPTHYASRITHYASRLTAHWDVLILVAILLFSAAVRFHQLDTFPNGCQSDECNNGLDALRWLDGARYLSYAETNEGQATLFTYLIALSFRLFGVGVVQMRVVAALAGVLTVLAFYFLGRDLYGRRAALVGTALLAASRWHMTFSRIVYELIMQPLAMILLALFLLRALRTGRRRYWALAGLALTFGLNTYTAFRVVPFVVAAFLLFWLVRVLITDRASLRHDLQGVALMAGAVLVSVAPLGIYIVQNWKVFTSRIQHISVMREVEAVGSMAPVVENLKKTLYMFNWRGDQAALNNLPGAPMFDTAVAILLVLGLAYALWYTLHARPVPVLYVLWFAGIVSLGVLSVSHEAPTARRTIGVVPLAYLFSALVADQLFQGWQTAWRGRGVRWFNAAVALVVALVMLSNVRVFFDVQATNPSVETAFSPYESAVGEYLTTLPSDATVLITPQFEHHSAIKLIARDHGHRALDVVDDLPFRGSTGGDLVYILEPADRPLLTLMQQIYPTGQADEHRAETGELLFLSYVVPQADLAATRGIVGQYFVTFPPVTAADARQREAALDLDLATGAPLDAPFFALWDGSLLVPEFGDYTFELTAEGESANVQIGREQRLDLPAGGTGTLTATLAAGFHPLRVEYHSGDAPGRLRLAWSGAGFNEQVVGGDVLYAFRLGDQGLVGYYFPNGTWEGDPAIVRNDLLIANNPLREPFSILWRGKIAVPTSGLYTFATRSDDGSFVFIDEQLVVDNGGSHGAEERSGQIQLDAGFHDIEVLYSELGGSREMQLFWQPPGQGRGLVDSSYLFPLEGDAVPAGLTLPAPPEISQVLREPEQGAGQVAAGAGERPETPGAAIQPAGDFGTLPADVLWSFGACGIGDGQLNAPRGVAVDARTGDVFIADTGNARIVRLDADGNLLGSWGSAGDGLDQFQEPADLVVEPDGSVLVLDAVGQRLQRFTAEGQFLASFGGDLTFYRPRGLGIDPAGQLVVADTGGVRIVRLSPDGTLLSQIGGPESDIARGQPTDAILSPGGDLYYVEAETGAVTMYAADGRLDRWGGPALASTIDGPHLVWLPAGGLAVTDPEGRRVLLFRPDGQPLGQLGPETGLAKPVGIAAASAADGVLVVADSQTCQVVAFAVAAP